MFDKDRFIQRCIENIAAGPAVVREIVAEAVSDPADVAAAFGEPAHAGVTPLYNTGDLTILHFVWAPYMILPPHNHRIFSVVGIYFGREDNVIWQRTDSSIQARSAKSLAAGDVAVLDREAIHSVTNPIGKMTCAIHVYGGDFFHPGLPRSEWDHETLAERPWSREGALARFREAEERYRAYVH